MHHWPDRFPADRDDFRLRARFRHALKRARVESGSHLLVAVSGGCDSIALLALASLESPGRRYTLTVGHVDHGLRPDSAEDVCWVEGAAASLGLSCRVTRLDRAPTANLEAWARGARRRALREMATGVGAERILLAHTEDDQAETVLLNLFRGTGLAGLAGMAAARGPWIRPLLGVSRADLRGFAERHRLVWREDPSNLDPRFSRNRLRHGLLPRIDELFGRSARRSVARAPESLRTVRDLLRREVRGAWARIASRPEPLVIRLDRPLLASYHRAILEECLRRAVKELTGSARDLNRSQLCSLSDAAQNGRRARFQLSHRVLAEIDGASVRFLQLGAEARCGPAERES
ncbi:MAG: tRNA lysidine(34) synthetase TilS [Candidatus Eisenbacteria bacterium]|nr:tRNA lysidine(34) synthetase TilS [Candidatus Eisenbacteria bacterium]MCC7140487.1 tRNA lysidine(34) synthetase TilS [Candidatus Eisenbacteria bacterium]